MSTAGEDSARSRELHRKPVLDRLVEAGRARLAVTPGSRPRMRAGDGTDRLGDALGALRDEERDAGTPVVDPRD
jgi:hypothetical protein